jgi:hypothetical protein
MEDLELLILILLLFGGFSAHFDLAGYWLFPAESHYSCGFLFYELMISGGIPFLLLPSFFQWIPHP